MDRKYLEEEVIKLTELRAQLMLAAIQKKEKKQANKELHAKVLRDTSDIIEKINSINSISVSH